MLPALDPQAPSLADVLRSCLESVQSAPNRLGLPPADSAIVLLVDGLGADALRASAGHARTLMSAMGKKDTIASGFPTTTASALASLTTGLTPGQHGLVGYSVLDPQNDRVINQLTGWDDRLDPHRWQAHPTLFETAGRLGLAPAAVGPAKFAESGFTQAVLRGANYVGARSIAERLEVAAELARTPGALVYVYVAELDQAGHAHGSQSSQWTRALEETDAALRSVAPTLSPRTGLLVTADHGMIDIPQHAHVIVDDTSELLEGVRHVAGEPRCLQLHLHDRRQTVALAQRWRAVEGERAWIATRDEAIAAGWFGAVRDDVVPRIGDVLIAARKNVAYYLAGSSGMTMVGQHGSWSPAELRVPLLRMGAYARGA
ncbi:alkaline phosphatase family protein [Leifsonia sp. H3M29-4]|uniref:alkaline phosphatase family protein n=1 Tax=Salinibacterium metalliresistens TaxID=3031321 RepID=UPI0023DC0436|nr:nucleotide pyrophosphatase/phosphodiesterase family protein [Salinibacterium metalliresistens]MDF1479750.1 alkaline phosphatase family protein [Salinibacterium metalliresistens]